MKPTLRIQPVDSVTATADVRDYDQLTPREQASLRDAVAAERTTTVPANTGFTDGEVIKYTRYLRVEL